MNTPAESNGQKNTISVRELITFEEAMQRLPAGNTLRSLHHSQLDTQMKQAVALRLLPDGIGIIGYEYDVGVTAELVTEDADVQQRVSLDVHAERSHVYDYLM